MVAPGLYSITGDCGDVLHYCGRCNCNSLFLSLVLLCLLWQCIWHYAWKVRPVIPYLLKQEMVDGVMPLANWIWAAWTKMILWYYYWWQMLVIIFCHPGQTVQNRVVEQWQALSLYSEGRISIRNTSLPSSIPFSHPSTRRPGLSKLWNNGPRLHTPASNYCTKTMLHSIYLTSPCSN